MRNIPFGSVQNSSHESFPIDLLHGWCSGILKNMLYFALTVIVKFDPDDNVHNRLATLSAKMSQLPIFPSVPGFGNVKFHKGISKLMKSNDFVSSLNSGDSTMTCGGGYHSKHLVSMLLHILLCIGWDGQILSNAQVKFKSEDESKCATVHPLQVLSKTVYNALSVYLMCRRPM